MYRLLALMLVVRVRSRTLRVFLPIVTMNLSVVVSGDRLERLLLLRSVSVLFWLAALFAVSRAVL
uniref:Uncharacterized protein n=1 Tax=Anguilla anguilla TaxID=7936 RepID=A0A0E9XLX8_ANGAN